MDKNETIEEESPAGKQRSLNINWISCEATNGNQITSNKPSNQDGYYWCVKSEEVLTGSFICKVQVDNIASNDYWNHTFGIVKEASLKRGDYYYNCIKVVYFHLIYYIIIQISKIINFIKLL